MITNRSKILEELYDNIDDPKCKKYIDLILLDSRYLEDAYRYLNNISDDSTNYDFFSNIKHKPIYKSVNRFMNDRLDDLEVMKMLSSIITQVLIQSSLNNEKTPSTIIESLSTLILSISKKGDHIDDIVKTDIRNLIKRLGWKE